MVRTMSANPSLAVAVAPASAPGWIADAVASGGGTVVPVEQAEGLVWFEPYRPQDLGSVLDRAPRVRWVHLPWAGVEPYLDVMTADRLWTCGKGVYAEPTAEHALLLALAGLRGLRERFDAHSWGARGGTTLRRQPVTIVGGGGIAEALVRFLDPFECPVTIVRRRPEPLGGATVVTVDRLHDALAGALVVVLALALTPATKGIIGRAELERMRPDAWLVNVARGGHVVTDDLVDALRRGVIAGAALDVTDPEPLPDSHPLWSLPNCLITPHTANTPEMVLDELAERVRDNVRRFAAGEPLVGLVDLDAGY